MTSDSRAISGVEGHKGARAPASADATGRLRVALLSYRSKPHCGGQGVYVRNLSRELVALGHQVEVFSGPRKSPSSSGRKPGAATALARSLGSIGTAARHAESIIVGTPGEYSAECGPPGSKIGGRPETTS